MKDPITNVYTPAAWEEVNCPVCNGSAYTVYEKFGSALQYRFVRCGHCALIYSSPRPRYDQDFIDSCYASYYQYSATVTVADLHKIKESSLHTFEKEMAQLLQFDKKRTAVLDIGSGMGTFLLAAKPHYRQLLGLDVSKQMAEFVRSEVGVPVVIEQFQDHRPALKYSLIHMSHVIEHVPNPNEWLQHAAAVLDEGGILVINVPNKLSLSNQVKHWLYKLGLKKQFSNAWNDPTRTPDHLFEPTVNSFRQLIQQNGFRILDHYSYSRKDPAANASLWSRFFNRTLKLGSNLTFITTRV